MDSSELIATSLDEGDIGYSGTIKKIETFEHPKSHYEIPNRYFIDSFTMLNINPQNSYLYWEESDATLEKFGIAPNDVKLRISIIDECENEISSFESVFSVGDYYFHHEQKSKKLIAKLDLQLQDNSFVPLFRSNTIKLFDATLKGYAHSPLLGEFLFETIQKEEDGEISSVHSMSLLKNKNLSSQTMLIKETR